MDMMNTHAQGFTSQHYNKRGSRDVDEIDYLKPALELIKKTLFSSSEGKEITDKIDSTEVLKESASKTAALLNPNLSDKQVYHSVLYLGWLVFFSFASIFGALAPLTMQMTTRNLDEPHNHIPGSTFQI